MTTTWERGRPARTKPGTASPISPASINRERCRSWTDCVKDVTGLYLITPPLRGSRRSRAARRRLMRWGVETEPPGDR